MSYNFKIVLWNANGLSRHKLELENFLNAQNINILLVSETHFSNKNFFKINGYHVYITNNLNGKAHGGTAILIKKNIRHYELPSYNQDNIQATSVRL